MGGKAFSSPGPQGQPALDVPRLPPALYEDMKSHCVTVLAKYYTKVWPLHDAPGKTDHGDIDIFVQGELMPKPFTRIVVELRALRWSIEANTQLFALPHPEGKPDTCVQLDIHICTEDTMAWQHFLHSYGDVGQILGAAIYNLGFTASDYGLYVRVEEMEKHGWRASWVFLSLDLEYIMTFLGLDIQRYNQGFDTEGELFEWLATCRMMVAGYTEHGLRDNADDRRRMETRPMFQRFMTYVVPTLRNKDEVAQTLNRTTFLNEALFYFNKKEEYDDKFKAFDLGRQEEVARILIVQHLTATTVLSKNKVNEVYRALRRWSYTKYTSTEGALLLKRNDACLESDAQIQFGQFVATSTEGDQYLEKSATRWIDENWRDLRSRERARLKAEKEGHPCIVFGGETRLVEHQGNSAATGSPASAATQETKVLDQKFNQAEVERDEAKAEAIMSEENAECSLDHGDGDICPPLPSHVC